LAIMAIGQPMAACPALTFCSVNCRAR
jgi:2'-5' RNA ligase